MLGVAYHIGMKHCNRLTMPCLSLQEWKTYSKNDVAAGLQSFLICIEMFFAALAHAYAFPPRDYMDPTVQPPPSFMHSLRIMFDVRDVVDDVHGVVDDTVSSRPLALPVPLLAPLVPPRDCT